MHRRALSSTRCRRGTHYETLGVRREASTDQIKTAFFALSKEHHPDVPHHKEKPQFHEITEAYNILRDPVSRRAYDNTLPAPQAPTPSTLHSRHMADTAARFRRASRPQQAASSTSSFSSRPRHTSPLETPFPRRPPSYTPLPGANDLHHRHPRQRYKPPDPVAQAAAWAEQQEFLREQKTRAPRFMTSIMLGFGAIITAGWLMGGLSHK
ncbi:DnaJ domain-containing protein [Mycena alexandri]|uniref:DnaJ domain-containing protein n=1 Tax=Mycena alexandri TaxID=1745969 RepID=A0AAD6SG28_9AGAR|nr:DnaJ domain-containing protein [Mycena alexandri]